MLGQINLSLARRTMLRQLGWGMDLDGVGENLSIVNPKNVYSGEYSLQKDFSGDTVGQAPAGLIQGTGQYLVKNADPSPFGGSKYTECTVAGSAAFPCNQSVGLWEFDWYKGADANQLYISIMADRVGANIGVNGYLFNPKPTESIEFRRSMVSTAPALCVTAAAYFENNKWYRTRIERLSNGQFTISIKGGSFANWTVISVVGGSGSNPVTDSNYTVSNYFILDLGAGDRIANIECQYASGSLDLFGWERFLHSGNRDFEVPVSYGPELVVDGGFNDPSKWTVGNPAWAVSGGKATCNLASGTANLYQPYNVTNGKLHFVTYTITDYVSGGVRAVLYANGQVAIGATRTANGTYSEYIYSSPGGSSTNLIAMQATGGFVGFVDNFSVKEVLSDWQKQGNHDCFITSEEKYSGSNCLKVVASGAGDANANHISISADKFITLIAGKKFCSQRRIKTSVDCTMSVQFGDKVVSRAIVAGSWILTPWTFEASANTTGKPCKIWFDRAVTAYMDEIGLAEHFPTTWSVWFRTSAAGSNIVLLSQNNGINTNTSLGYALRKSATDVINLLVYDQSGNAYSISSAGVNCADGKWHLATITLDASLPGGQCKVFIDGIFIASGTAAIGNINNTSVYTVGKYAYTPVGYWLGQIGQIQQIRGVKSDTQILADFKGGIARRNDSMLNLKFSGMDDATMLKDYSPLQQLVTGINVTRADQVRGSYPYYSR